MTPGASSPRSNRGRSPKPATSTSKLSTPNKQVKPGSGIASATKPGEPELFGTFCQLWAYQELVCLYMSTGGFRNASLMEAVPIVLNLASLFGSMPMIIGAHLWCVMDCFWFQKPFKSGDCSHWVAHHSMAFLLIILAVIAGRCKKDGISHVFKSLTPSEYKSILDGSTSVIRVQLVVWYSGATIWKLNRGFFDPSNCNAIYLVSLIAAYLPLSLTADWLVKLAAWSAPYVTIVVEGGIATSFVTPGWSSRCGIALGLLLHLLIAITPPPLNVGIYGLKVTAWYFFFVPETTTQVVAEMKTTITSACVACGRNFMQWVNPTKQVEAGEMPSLQSMGALLAAALAVYASSAVSLGWTFPYMPEGGGGISRDWIISAYFVYVLVYSKSLYLDATSVASQRKAGTGWLYGKVWWILFAEAMVFVYGLLILGLQDNGPPKPFSHIRMHGGSNHYFLPVTLIQDFFGGSPYFSGSAFSSEVVRVENTNSSYMNFMLPVERTDAIDSRTQELLKMVGHSGRMFAPLSAHLGRPIKPNQPGPEFVRYTIPVFEFRRALEEVRKRNESFVVKYTHLSRYDANQGADTASGKQVQFHEDGTGGKTCSLVGKKAPCGSDELVFLPPLSLTDPWSSKLMGFWPHPIIPGQSEPHSGYCWGE